MFLCNYQTPKPEKAKKEKKLKIKSSDSEEESEEESESEEDGGFNDSPIDPDLRLLLDSTLPLLKSRNTGV